ncbi:AraC family transcriptional regulator [Rhodoferax sp.]|uniref:AraC family transcriptional regulator n=1 Tax=Rhodoferax sp. TaxID=50421 RepID=UPI0026358ADA|nr:AraC family transcriptional regulator [Rhodoferax sp.]MDD3935243.1 AraC family transcriptional regulator [Rhodoferax sp.]
MQKDTVSIYFIRAAVTRLSPEARARVLYSAAIPEEFLSSNNARVTAASFAALWMAVARELDDEFFGMDRRRMKVGSFALLCHAVLHSQNLGQAVSGILRGLAIFLDDVRGTLQVSGDRATIGITNKMMTIDSRRFADETFLVMVHGLMCWLAGKRIVLSLVEFSGPCPPYSREYNIMFSQHLRFDASLTGVHFDAKLLGAPVVQNAETLKTLLREAPQSIFLKYKNTNSWTARVRRRMRGCMGAVGWPILMEIAKEFNVAPSTLRRRLDAEGVSFQEIKDDLRRDAAIHYLSNTQISVSDVAGLLGFQEVSAFRRAFKAWTGMRPTHYRTLVL